MTSQIYINIYLSTYYKVYFLVFNFSGKGTHKLIMTPKDRVIPKTLKKPQWFLRLALNIKRETLALSKFLKNLK